MRCSKTSSFLWGEVGVKKYVAPCSILACYGRVITTKKNLKKNDIVKWFYSGTRCAVNCIVLHKHARAYIKVNCFELVYCVLSIIAL